MIESEKEIKSLLIRVKVENEKAGIKETNKQKNTKQNTDRSQYPVPSLHGKMKGKKWKQ